MKFGDVRRKFGQSGLPKSLPLTDPRNHYWLERLKAWTGAAERVYIWEYTCERLDASPIPISVGLSSC